MMSRPSARRRQPPRPPDRAARGRGLAAAAAALLAARSARVRRTVREVGRGAAVLRRPGHCARHVLPFQAGARVLRLGSATCFLLAFGLPVAPAIVVAGSSRGPGAAVPLPGAGLAAIGAALLVALPFAAGHALDRGALASLAVVWPAAIMVWVAISLGLLARLSGARTPRALGAPPTPCERTPPQSRHDSRARLGRARGVLARHRRAALAGPRVAGPDRGMVLAFGAGALVSAVSFDSLSRASDRQRRAVAGGLAVGALAYFGPTVSSSGGAGAAPARRSRSAPSSTASPSRWCSASAWRPARASVSACWRDLRLQPARGDRLVERHARGGQPRGHDPAPVGGRRGVCTLATVVGFAIADSASGNLKAGIDGFAAGALLVMLIDSMIPEASRRAGDVAGLVTVLGFAVAIAL